MVPAAIDKCSETPLTLAAVAAAVPVGSMQPMDNCHEILLEPALDGISPIDCGVTALAPAYAVADADAVAPLDK